MKVAETVVGIAATTTPETRDQSLPEGSAKRFRSDRATARKV
jgi:hypothetical protein